MPSAAVQKKTSYDALKEAGHVAAGGWVGLRGKGNVDRQGTDPYLGAIHGGIQVVRYGLCAHDGSYTLDYYDEEIDVAHLDTTAEKVEFFEGHIIKKVGSWREGGVR